MDQLLAPGESFYTTLSRNLLDSDAVVCIISKHSNESRYAFTEIEAAIGYFNERGRPAVIPVVLDDSPVPPPISHISAIIASGRSTADVAGQIASAFGHIKVKEQAQEEKRREIFQRVETNAPDYIKTSKEYLIEREKRYRKIAYGCYVVAGVSLIATPVVAILRSLSLSENLTDWLVFAGFVAIGIIMLGSLVAFARFAFMLGKSFMVESLRNSDRIHAISFGEFYLKIFPDKLEWSAIKEAFQHWNIDRGSYFSHQKSQDFDNDVLKTAATIAGIIARSQDKKSP
jgi:hypothetical protein